MMDRTKIKICGMTDTGNVREICLLSPDYLGFIFYPESARYVGDKPDPGLFEEVPPHIIKTAVFVNSSSEKILDISGRYKIDHLQLHGTETPEICGQLRSNGKTIIKAIPGDQLDDIELLTTYANVCDHFLFDTPTLAFGGSGRKFDWTILEELAVPRSFFLSGGIGPGDADSILRIKNRQLHAVDVNSRFESEPGIKDVELLRSFINLIRHED